MGSTLRLAYPTEMLPPLPHLGFFSRAFSFSSSMKKKFIANTHRWLLSCKAMNSVPHTYRNSKRVLKIITSQSNEAIHFKRHILMCDSACNYYHSSIPNRRYLTKIFCPVPYPTPLHRMKFKLKELHASKPFPTCSSSNSTLCFLQEEGRG